MIYYYYYYYKIQLHNYGWNEARQLTRTKDPQKSPEVIFYTQCIYFGFLLSVGYCNEISLAQSDPINLCLLYNRHIMWFFCFFLGVPHLATFIFNFSLKVIARKLHISISIRCRGLNPRPLGHEPSALTTRPWLFAKTDT